MQKRRMNRRRNRDFIKKHPDLVEKSACLIVEIAELKRQDLLWSAKKVGERKLNRIYDRHLSKINRKLASAKNEIEIFLGELPTTLQEKVLEFICNSLNCSGLTVQKVKTEVFSIPTGFDELLEQRTRGLGLMPQGITSALDVTAAVEFLNSRWNSV